MKNVIETSLKVYIPEELIQKGLHNGELYYEGDLICARTDKIYMSYMKVIWAKHDFLNVLKELRRLGYTEKAKELENKVFALYPDFDKCKEFMIAVYKQSGYTYISKRFKNIDWVDLF